MSDFNTELFINVFRKYRLWLLFYVAGATLFIGYMIRPTILKYRAMCTFYVAPDPKGPEVMLYNTPVNMRAELNKVYKGYERILQFSSSNQMMDHLIRAYSLYNYYGIDSTSRYARAKVINILSSRIEVYKISPEIMRVAIYDRNNEIASAMANSIVKYLDKMNKEYLDNALKQDIEVYRNYITEGKQLIAEQHEILGKSIQDLKDVSSSSGNNETAKQIIQRAGVNIKDASDKIGSLSEGMVGSFSLYENAVGRSREVSGNSIVVLKRAFPEMSSKKPQLAMYSIATALLSAIVLLLLLYFFHAARPYLVRMFGK